MRKLSLLKKPSVTVFVEDFEIKFCDNFDVDGLFDSSAPKARSQFNRPNMSKSRGIFKSMKLVT